MVVIARNAVLRCIKCCEDFRPALDHLITALTVILIVTFERATNRFMSYSWAVTVQLEPELHLSMTPDSLSRSEPDLLCCLHVALESGT